MTIASPLGGDATRLLALLEDARHHGMTVAELRERGIEAPAQAIYALQLAGYEIDRLPSRNGHRHRGSAYRLTGVSMHTTVPTTLTDSAQAARRAPKVGAE